MLKRKRSIEETADETARILKSKGSYNAGSFWEKLAGVDEQNLQANDLGRKISMASMDYSEENPDHVRAWQSSEEGVVLLEQQQALTRRLAYIVKQKDLFVNQDIDASLTLRRSYAQVFIQASNGMDIRTGYHRPNALQAQFRNELKQLMGRHPSDSPSDIDIWWCPILADYCDVIRAGHLFASRCGRIAMDAIFGPQQLTEWVNPKDGASRKSELYRAVNGILWSQSAEKRFGKGLFVLVPDVKSDPTDADLRAWQASSPKDYKIHILRPNHPLMRAAINRYNPNPWTSLEGRKVHWSDPAKEPVNFRPRARYLYWTYLEAVLRKFYESEAKEEHLQAHTAQKEVGKKFWGSAGSYMPKNMLLGFVEQIGHTSYNEDLMAKNFPSSKEEKTEEEKEKEEEAEEDKATDCAVAVATQAILDKHQRSEADDDDNPDLYD